jgi:hypothetical protein
MNAKTLLGVAVGKLSLAPGDMLLVFCPEDWSAVHVEMFQGWARNLYPNTNMMFLTHAMTAAIVEANLGEQLRLVDPLALRPSQVN